jgi:23S rRNA pseudouridine1911/1915/1917 synthase
MDRDSTEVSSQKLVVSADGAGKRFDVFIAAELQVSRARAQKLLEGATVNNVPAKPSLVLKAGDEIVMRREARGEGQEEPSASCLSPLASYLLPPILFEDEHLLIINKPRGLVVHQGAGEQGSTLVDILRAHGKNLSSVGPPERAGIVHRLDKDTSGVLAVCKTDAAHWKLAEAFATRRVTKEYAALVCGVPPAPGRVEAPIARHPVHRKKMAVVASGRPAVTEYSVEKSWPKFALLKVNILTGRTHQIRVHLQYVGYPVVGDAIYGGLKRALENASNEDVVNAINALQGQALHAAHLSFAHPVTGEVLSFHAPLPEDMQRVVDVLNHRGTETQST